MDIENIEKKLNKIKTVLEVFKDDGKLSKIEKDLLKGYIRDLYDSVCFIEKDTSSISKDRNLESSTKFEEVISTKIEESQLESNPPIEEKSNQKEGPKIEVVEVSTLPLNKPEIKTHQEEIIFAQPIILESILEKKVVVEEIKSQTISLDNSHAELLALFSDEEHTDISDKLSMKKIDQIATSIGINDRFFMINELFNGDGTLFSKTLEKLDASSSLEDAKKIVLTDIAVPMRWVENNKLVAAEEFIKLIKRKYK